MLGAHSQQKSQLLMHHHGIVSEWLKHRRWTRYRFGLCPQGVRIPSLASTLTHVDTRVRTHPRRRARGRSPTITHDHARTQTTARAAQGHNLEPREAFSLVLTETVSRALSSQCHGACGLVAMTPASHDSTALPLEGRGSFRCLPRRLPSAALPPPRRSVRLCECECVCAFVCACVLSVVCGPGADVSALALAQGVLFPIGFWARRS